MQARCNLLERGALGRADALPVLPVSVGDPAREIEHEPLVVLKLLRRVGALTRFRVGRPDSDSWSGLAFRRLEELSLFWSSCSSCSDPSAARGVAFSLREV
jgi:hypothetical protein